MRVLEQVPGTGRTVLLITQKFVSPEVLSIASWVNYKMASLASLLLPAMVCAADILSVKRLHLLARAWL